MFHPSTIETDTLCWSDNGHLTRKLWRKLSCLLFGHKVSNVAFEAMHGSAKHCSCGADYLGAHEETRVSHTVSCFVLLGLGAAYAGIQSLRSRSSQELPAESNLP